ncbi:MAG: hypothetical protein Kow0092_01400 [Deferrisomatales bacterium]
MLGELSEAGGRPGLTRLAVSVHSAQAQGLLRDPDTVEQLLLGIARALANTVEGNARDPETAWALESAVYWAHFEMDIKEALLGAFSGLDPTLCRAVRDVVELTLETLKRKHGGL